ncbi:MAG: type II secretion system protein [Mariprofundales bacterium]
MKQPVDHQSYGFTLIEIIGVLAVMSIMAATIAPSAIQMITAGKQSAEDSAMAAIADALRLHVLNNKKIPSQTTWASDLSALLNTAPSKVTTNDSNGARIYLYPDNFVSTGNSLAYDQYAKIAADVTAGSISNLPTAPLSNPRVMVISNLNPGTPLTQASGQLAATTFDNIWNQSGNFPAELTENDNLKIARINLSDTFESLVLNNNDTTATASYQIDGTTMPAIAVSSTITLQLIKGSQISLLDSYGNIYNRHVLSTATSFSYLSNWGGTLGSTGGSSGSGSGSGSGGSSSSAASAVTTLTNSTTSALNTAPDPSCSTTGNYQLTVINNNTKEDYYLYSGDSAGNTTFPAATDCGNDNKAKKKKTCHWQIADCSMVVIVPRVKQAPAQVFLFYMPNSAKTITAP